MTEASETNGAVATVSSGRDVDGNVLISIAGELDMSNIEGASESLKRCVSKADGAPVVFDLAELRFMDSSGIALLLQVAEPRGSVVLRNVPGLIRRIIDATGVQGVLEVEP